MLPVIEFQQVSKRYRLKQSKPASGGRATGRNLWALQDISFSVEPGQALGIIGFNGAGKTTILKLIAGITEPTKGKVTQKGRITALIELGAGFHPDLTGRENVHLSAAMFGMRRREIHDHFDDIVEFAEMEDFIDTPVKRYSTGMQARLAFAVAVHANPDILLVDEVLSVGDASFQVRCMERMQELREGGVTLVFVSHYLGLIVDACEQAIFLDAGHIQFVGPVQEVVNRYQDAIRASGKAQMGATPSGAGARSGSFDVEITSVALLDEMGRDRSIWDIGQPMTVQIGYLAHRAITAPIFGVEITRNDGLDCFATNTAWDGMSTGQVLGSGMVELQIPRLTLTAGSYYIGVGILERTGTAFLDFHDKAYHFEVKTERKHRGAVYLDHRWQFVPAHTSSPSGKQKESEG